MDQSPVRSPPSYTGATAANHLVQGFGSKVPQGCSGRPVTVTVAERRSLRTIRIHVPHRVNVIDDLHSNGTMPPIIANLAQLAHDANTSRGRGSSPTDPNCLIHRPCKRHDQPQRACGVTFGRPSLKGQAVMASPPPGEASCFSIIRRQCLSARVFEDG